MFKLSNRMAVTNATYFIGNLEVYTLRAPSIFSTEFVALKHDFNETIYKYKKI